MSRWLCVLCVIGGTSMLVHAGTPVDTASLIRQRIMKAYGADRFQDIDAFTYTFNIQSGDRKVKRVWTWEPKRGCVTFHGKGPAGSIIDYSYTHTKTDTSDTTLDTYVDQRFINDNYWLFFPFHLAWDSNLVYNTTGVILSPELGNAEHLVVRYTGGGYTPGDMYVLFPDAMGLLRWWVFYRGAKEDQGSMMTWDDPIRVGPITLSTSHRNTDGTFKLWFSDIAFKLHGDDKWIKAQ